MEAKTILFLGYGILGTLFILFNKQIGDFNYKIVLYYTDKLRLKDWFIFKVDHKNKNSMYFLTRSFSVIFGISILASSIYHLYF